jgi:hypothetical protein
MPKACARTNAYLRRRPAHRKYAPARTPRQSCPKAALIRPNACLEVTPYPTQYVLVRTVAAARKQHSSARTPR